MLEITKTPEKAIQGTGFTSKWLAADSPIVFEVQRKDNNISTTVNDGGKARITLSTSNSLFYLSVGEFISVHDAISGVSFITSVLTKHSDTDYTLNIAYASQQFSYYVAYQKPVNYFFEVKLTVNGVEQSATARFTPQLNGLAKCDISGYLQTYVSDEKVGTYIDNNTAETNQSGNFTFAVSENYIGNTNTTYLVNNNIWYYVKAARSIEKGANVAEFVPNLEAQAEFLNYFEEPTYWLGLPFDISFVYSELLAGKPIQIIEEHYNSLNVLLSTQIKDLDANAIGYLNSAAIKAESIEPTCDYITLSLVTDDAQPPVVVNTWYITESPFTPSNPLKFVKNGSNVAVTGEMSDIKAYSTPAIPHVSLIPNVEVPIIISYNINFFQNIYRDPPRSFYELGINATEFAKFNQPFRFYCLIAINKTYAVGFVDINPASVTTKVAFMNAIKSAFDSAVSSINTSVGVIYLQTMNSNEENRARSRVYLASAYSSKFVSLAYWYYAPVALEVYLGNQTSYSVLADTEKVMYNITESVEYGKLKTDGTTEFVAYNNLGCDIRVVLPTTNYTV